MRPSVTPSAPRGLALALALVLALTVIASLVGCTSGGNGPVGPGGGTHVDDRVRVILEANPSLEALQVDLALAPDVSLVAATAVGPMSGALCAENLTLGSLGCTSFAGFTTPTAVYELTLRRPVGLTVSASVTELVCTGAAAEAEPIDVSCSIADF